MNYNKNNTFIPRDKNGNIFQGGDIIKLWNGNLTVLWYDGTYYRTGINGKIVGEYDWLDMKIVGRITLTNKYPSKEEIKENLN